MKRNISILSALLCIAFLFASCPNPTQTESGSKPKSGSGVTGGGTIGGGTEEVPVEDSPPGDKDFEFVIEDDEGGETPTDEPPTISASKADASEKDVTLATAKLPKDGGPWDAKLVEPTEQINNTARISPSEGSIDSPFEVSVDNEKSELYVKLKQGNKLNSGLYSINLVIKGANDITIYKTFTFEVLAPDPIPTAKDFNVKFEGAGERDGIPTISGAALDTSEGSVTLATVTPPKKGGPWTVELDDAALELFDAEVDAGNDIVRIVLKKNKTLGWGRYSINLVIKDAGDITIYKTFTFDVVLTPAPFTKTPSLYPEITGAGKNKLTVNWALASGAERYNVYINTTTERPQTPNNTDTIGPLTQTCDITDIDGDGTDGGLPDGTKYYVWVEAVNDGGSSFSDPAERTTSGTMDSIFYHHIAEDGRVMYSWDSFSGDGDTGKGGADYYRITEPDAEHPGGTMFYGGNVGTSQFGFSGDIRYFVEFDKEEAKRLAPHTQYGKWEERLDDKPSGVFIVEYNEPEGNAGQRKFQGIYYWGVGAIQTTTGGNLGPAPTRNPQGLELIYFSNSYGLRSSGRENGKFAGNPETETLAQAIDRFTLENMVEFIAFVATPWYRCYGYDNIPGSQVTAEPEDEE
jgi:hypothetical protein